MTARPSKITAEAERNQAVWDALNEAVQRVRKIAGPYRSAGWNAAITKAVEAVAGLRDERAS